MTETITSLLSRHNPDAVALLAPDRAPLSYRLLGEQVERVVAALRARGIQRHDPVAVALPNGPDLAMALLGVSSAAVCVPLHPAHSAEFDSDLAKLGAKAFIVQSGADSPVRRAAQSLGVSLIELPGDLDDTGHASDFAAADDCALLLHTSGTTGRPKAAALTHRNLLAAAENVCRGLGLTAQDRALNIMPLTHGHGIVVLLAALRAGGSVVCPANFSGPAFADWLEHFRPTWYSASPSIHQLILARATPGASSLRVIRSGSAHLPARLQADLERVFGVPVLDYWGMTEALASYCTPPRPLVSEIAIVDDAGKALPRGQVGEISVRGPNVFTEGWLRSGDLGCLDADGNLSVTGRLKELINRGGQKVSPLEVDSVLLEHPAVAEAATVGIADPRLGEEVAAAVVLRAEVSPRELREFVAKRLADFKVPRQILFVPSLARNAAGKVDRLRLARTLPFELAGGRDRPAFVAPRNPLEAELAAIVRELLRVERIGVNDHFSDLGGDSILAAQLLVRVRQVKDTELSLLDFYDGGQTIAALARLIEAGRAQSPVPLVRVSREGPLVPSFSQEQLWLIDQFEPASPLYNICRAFIVRGALNVAALQRALNEIVARHDPLRTTFRSVAGAPVPVVNPPRAVELRVITDVRDEARRPFDLSRDLMLRAALIKQSEHKHILLLTIHHIAADGWSLGVLFRELGVLYRAFAAGSASPLAPLPIHYADFAAWQRRQTLEAHLAYWKQQLGNSDTALQLPTDRPRPARPTYEGAAEYRRLPKSLGDSLKTLSRQENATLFMTLLAAFKVLLHRYSGQDEIRVGTPIVNRPRVEFESLIGFLVNTLVLRSDLAGEPTFRELLARVRRTALEATAHQDLPFEKLVAELHPQRHSSVSPLFQVFFAFQNMPAVRPALDDLELQRIEVDTGTAKFDLSLLITDSGNELSCALEYNTALFDAGTITRLGDHFERLLQSVVRNPGQRITELDFLSEAERRRLLVEWNDTRTAPARAQCVQELFEQQVRKTPDAVAVESAEGQLTYAELNDRANRRAAQLRAEGVGPELRVPIRLERSIEMVVAVLAVLKAGGAYVPIDPTYPPERIEFMLADSQAGTATWQNLAYVIYTSGSTGRPKGVAMPHRALVNLITWQCRHAPGLRTLQFASLSFDVSFQEMFSTWASGGTLVLVPEELRTDFNRLWDFIRQRRIERLFLPFVALQALAAVARDRVSLPVDLREVITAGEQLQITPDIRALFERLDGCTLHNHYGPTESHVVTAFTLTGPPRDWPVLPPVGRPIANTQVYLLDARLQPVPVGVPGELFIGGDCLARGYLNRAELTAERFIANPFIPGARLYRTGDRARYRADGQIEFLGRTDQQVKVRGFRVELGEIEAVLREHPAVSDAAVTADMVACVVGEADSAELREFLRQKLPDYMLPRAFVFLESLPLTPSGKIDRTSLPAPELAREEFVAPRNRTEQIICGIWSEVLGRPTVGVHDNFFDLGGHSLLATQVASRMRNAFGVDLPLRRLFELPTVAKQARELAEPALLNLLRDLHPARPEPLPLSFAQQRLWFLDQFEPGSFTYNIPAMVRLRGRLDRAVLERSFTEIVRRHEILRTALVGIEGDPIQKICPPMPVAVPLIDLRGLTAAEKEVERLALGDAHRPFDLTRPPLLRVSLLQLADDDHVLLLNVHHVAADGWSLGVLVRELNVLYAAFQRGEPSPLPELTMQYADFAVWQRMWLKGEVLQTQLGYWKRQLSGRLPVLALPTDRPRPALQSANGASESRLLSPALAAALQALSRREGATLYMTLLAVFQTLLHRFTGQEDILVGGTIANRNRAEIEGLIGFFVNTLVLRADFSGRPSFREVLGRVREVALEAYAHQDLPFEKLVEELRPARSASHAPLFQVMFDLRNAPRQPVELPGLAASPLQFHNCAPKVDLSVSVEDEEAGLRVSCLFKTDLWDRPTIARFLGHYQVLLEAIAADPDRHISEL